MTQHGACLGLGLAALGSEDEAISEEIKNVLYTDSAVAGEAAGIALGLVFVGSATEKASELLIYAHDTQHEKVGCPSSHSWTSRTYFYISHCMHTCHGTCRICTFLGVSSNETFAPAWSFDVLLALAQPLSGQCMMAEKQGLGVQIIRGVALGLALIMYGQEEGAETLVEEMTRDQDPILRCAVALVSLSTVCKFHSPPILSVRVVHHTH